MALPLLFFFLSFWFLYVIFPANNYVIYPEQSLSMSQASHEKNLGVLLVCLTLRAAALRLVLLKLFVALRLAKKKK